MFTLIRKPMTVTKKRLSPGEGALSVPTGQQVYTISKCDNRPLIMSVHALHHIQVWNPLKTLQMSIFTYARNIITCHHK